MIRNANERPRRVAVVLLGILLLAACGREDAPDATSARRIVSLYPAATEILFAIGAGDRVVARSRWCDHPPEVLALPAVGDALGTSAESVLALGPDLVLVGSRTQEEALAPLASRVRVRRVTADHVLEVLDLVTWLGEATGRSDAAGRLHRAIRDAIGRHEVTGPGGDPVTYVFVVQREPLIVAGDDSYVAELLARVGGENVAAGAPGAWPTLSLETLVKRSPRVVIDAAMTDDAGFWRRFPDLEGRVVRVTETAVLRPGPRIPKALDILARRLHGEGR